MVMSFLLYYVLFVLGSYVVIFMYFLRRFYLLYIFWVLVFFFRLGVYRGGKLGMGRMRG